MALFFFLLTTAFSCIFYGGILTAVIMAVLYFFLKTIGQGIVRSISFYLIGVVLAFQLICNFSVMIGAFQVKGATASMELSLKQMTENMSGLVNTNESQEVFNYLLEEYPLLGCYLQLADFSGNDVTELATVIPEVIREEMNSIIGSKLLWSLGYIVVACVLAVLFEKKVYRSPGNSWQKEYYADI